MNKCHSCGSDKLCRISAKCSDLFSYTNLWSGKEYDGYVPYPLKIGGGDYVEFTYCRDCGQIQENFETKIGPPGLCAE